MNALRWQRLLCGGVMLLLALLFFHQLAFGGKILARGDTFKYFYPYWDARNAAFRAGELPLWAPELFTGVPLLANPQLGTYYPLNWLTAPFRAPTAVSLSILLHTALAAAGACALYRIAISRRWLPGLVAGIVFAFGGYLGAHVEQINQLQGLAWMPVLFALFHRLLIGERAWRAGFLLAMAWTMQILSGHTQTVFISGIGLALYGIACDGGAAGNWRDRLTARVRRALLLLAVCFALALMLALPQLLPSLELSSLSNRSSGFSVQEATAFSLPPSVLGRALLPSYDGQLFGEYVATAGVIGLGLALWGAASDAFSIRKRWLWILLALVGLALAFGRYNPLYLLLAHLPGFNLFRVPARFLALFALAIALLAGMGVESLGRTPAQSLRRWKRIAMVAAFIALLIAVTRFVLQPEGNLLFGGPAISEGSLLIWAGSALLLVCLLPLRHRWTPIAAAVLLVAELFLASLNMPYNDLSPPDVYLSQRETAGALLALQAEEVAPSRLIAISPLYFDPLDISDLRARYGRLGMDYEAQFHALDAIKLQETLMPNLPLTWGIPSIDGFGGGITPSRRFSLYSTLLQPPDALPAVDGRLGERLTPRSCRAACIPPLRWLRATDTRTVITDKVFDFWHDGVFYDTALWDFWDGVAELEQPLDGRFDRVGVVHRRPLDFDAPALPVQEGFSLTVTDMAGLPAILRQEPGIVAVTAINSAVPDDFQEIQPPPFERVYSGAVKVYRTPPSGKRAYLAAEILNVADNHAGDMEALRLLQEGGVAVIHGAADARNSTPGASGRVDILDYRDTRVSLAVSAPRAATLILSDAWHPGWRASVNGRPTPIQRANLIFRAVRVPAGESSVVFSFEPQLWRAALYIGCALWLITLLAAIGPAAFSRYRLKSRRSGK
ncbi:MAG: YfhO family protein [Chloroflexi bacterium]|nr:YfhO family protein [Chloroflexota bacterium]